MRKRAFAACAVALVCGIALAVRAETPWDERYFPNVELTTQDGDVVQFFDDLVKDKIVVINFIYTTCPDTCPLETAHLVRVQKILGDRLGKDIFFYSITIDPDHDTIEVLKKYKEQFGARWTFLTGDEDDIVLLRKKLGLYVPEIQDDASNNHNVSMIIGNQATGRWMKRGPFENPHVLADQIGNWLDGWKSPPRGEDYADAPKLRSLPRGEQIFRTRCAPCHTLTGHEQPDALGPDLAGVTARRERAWLLEWLRAPDAMLERGDPIAVALYDRYNELTMPNMRLNEMEALDILAYLDGKPLPEGANPTPDRAPKPGATRDLVTVVDAWIREPRPGATVSAGYMTLVNPGSGDLELVGVKSDAFESIEVHEMTDIDGRMSMSAVPRLPIAAGGNIQLAPGGMHLMMMRPRRELAAGGEIELTLAFESGRDQTVSVPISNR